MNLKIHNIPNLDTMPVRILRFLYTKNCNFSSIFLQKKKTEIAEEKETRFLPKTGNKNHRFTSKTNKFVS